MCGIATVVSPDGHHSVTKIFVDMPAVRKDCFSDAEKKAIHDVDDIVRHMAVAESSEVMNIAKKDDNGKFFGFNGAGVFGLTLIALIIVTDESLNGKVVEGD